MSLQAPYLSNSSRFASTSGTSCERILYYRRNRIGTGFDHHVSLFMRMFFDAAHFNFTHLIIDNMDLSASHNYEHRSTINQSWWHYLDIDNLSEISNINILSKYNPLTHALLRKHRSTVSYFEIPLICNYSVPFRGCGVSVRTMVGKYWWKTPECIANEKVAWDKKASANVLQCVKDLDLKDDDTCFIHGMIRRGDKLHEYNRKYRQLISSERISTLFMSLAQRFCEKNERIVFYLGTNGDDAYEYIEDAQSRSENVTFMTKEDLFVRNVKCALELKENNYFLYKVEKEIGRNSYIADVHFHFNPKYMGSSMFNDKFQINVRGSNTFIALDDL